MKQNKPLNPKVKKLTIVTSVIFVVALLLVFYVYHYSSEKPPIPLDTENQPTLGKKEAQIHLVIFEDPLCDKCIEFHRDVYFNLFKKYIISGKAKVTFILVAKSPASEEFSQMLLCTKEQSQNGFFYLLNTYMNEPLYKGFSKQRLFEETQRRIAKKHLDINLTSLKYCMQSEKTSHQVAENTQYARDLQGGSVRVPLVYVDGYSIPKPTFKNIEAAINKQLKNRS